MSPLRLTLCLLLIVAFSDVIVTEEIVCSEIEEYHECAAECERLCPNLEGNCNLNPVCEPGCRCIDGHVRLMGSCLPKNLCEEVAKYSFDYDARI